MFPGSHHAQLGSMAMAETLRDLIDSGDLEVGTTLHHSPRRYADRRVTATVEREGIRLKGHLYETPSAAARSITGTPVDGWGWWRLPDGRRVDALRSGVVRLV
jgi:RAMA domain-containing protein/DUF2924 family protein